MEESQKLIRDTKNYLLEQENRIFFLTEKEIPFFEVSQILPKKEKKIFLESEATLPIEKPTKIEKSFSYKKIKDEIPIKKPFLKSEEKLAKEEKQDFIILEKLLKPEISFEKLKSIIEEVFPSYPLVSLIPSDEKAKMLSQGYKLKKKAAEITILSFKENPQGQLFLKNLAQALEICFMPTKVVSALEIEAENKWNILLSEEDLKLIIATDYSIWELPHLIPHYKEIPSKNEHFLSNIPLFLLPDVSLYLKEPMIKKSLFTALRKKLFL